MSNNKKMIPAAEFAQEMKVRAEIFEDTCRRIEYDPYLMRATAKLMKDSELIPMNYTAPEHFEKTALHNLTIVEDSTFSCASKYAKAFHTCVLDFASSTSVGGGVLTGARAQEESLCRCSNLYYGLNQKRFHEQYYGWNRSHPQAHGSDMLIYVPDVTVIKDDSPECELLPEIERFRTDVIACAAPNLRTHEAVADTELLKLHIRRGRNILEAAIAHDVDALILGAFGCGAFKNDPNIVAEAYRTLLINEGYAWYFRRVIFAIKKNHSDSGNYAAFSKAFG